MKAHGVRPRRGHVLMMVATLSWGIGTAVGKLALDRTGMRPVTFLTVQLACSITVLALVVAVRRAPLGAPAWRSGRNGLLEPGASYVLGMIGLSSTAASHASVIGALEPTFVALGAWAVLRERISARGAVLMALSLVGILLVVGGGTVADASVGGDALMVVSVACAAGFVIRSARDPGRSSPVAIALTQQVWSLAVVLPSLAVAIGVAGIGPAPDLRHWWLVACSGILSYVLPFALYLVAVRHLPATVVGQHLALIPLCGLAAAAAILGEMITARSLLGAALVVTALVLLTRSSAVNAGREMPPDDISRPKFEGAVLSSGSGRS